MAAKYKISRTLLAIFYLQFSLSIQSPCRNTIYKSVLRKEGISYWNTDSENAFKKNYAKVSDSLLLDLNGLFLKQINPGCGRMENRVGILSDGSRICIRYRINFEQIQGEVYSHFLSKLLGIRNVLEPKLLLINQTGDFWRRINIKENSWDNMKVVTATKFIKNTLPVRLPDAVLKGNFRIGLSTSFCGLDNKTNMGIKMFLFQWSDLVIFDYLIGNFDRVVSNMFNLQWYSRSMVEPIENLMQLKNGMLLFIDNEEGFSHGYRLLDRYEGFLVKLIQNMCIFRKETVGRLQVLHRLSWQELQQQLWHLLAKTYKNTNILDHFIKMSQHNINILKNRINLVLKFVTGCKSRGET